MNADKSKSEKKQQSAIHLFAFHRRPSAFICGQMLGFQTMRKSVAFVGAAGVAGAGCSRAEATAVRR
jgi:hypothetical protein